MSTWNEEIKVLEEFFTGREMPRGNIPLSQSETIIDPRLFLKIHFQIVKENNGNERYRPYLTRLQGFMEKLKNK